MGSKASRRDAELVASLVAYAVEHQGDSDLTALDELTWGHPDFPTDPGRRRGVVIPAVAGAIYEWADERNAEPHIDLINVVTGRHGNVEQLTLEVLVAEGALEPVAGSASIFRVVGLPQRRRGRPAMGKPLMIRLPEGMRAAVDRVAAHDGISAAEAVRNLIARGLAERPASGEPAE